MHHPAEGMLNGEPMHHPAEGKMTLGENVVGPV